MDDKAEAEMLVLERMMAAIGSLSVTLGAELTMAAGGS